MLFFDLLRVARLCLLTLLARVDNSQQSFGLYKVAWDKYKHYANQQVGHGVVQLSVLQRLEWCGHCSNDMCTYLCTFYFLQFVAVCDIYLFIGYSVGSCQCCPKFFPQAVLGPCFLDGEIHTILHQERACCCGMSAGGTTIILINCQ